MTTPRYTVGSVSGFSIGERSGGGGHYGTIWYVYDRAYCHKTVGLPLTDVTVRGRTERPGGRAGGARACGFVERGRGRMRHGLEPRQPDADTSETRTLSATPGFWGPVAARRAAGENAEPTSSPEQLPLWEWDGELPVPYGVVPY